MRTITLALITLAIPAVAAAQPAGPPIRLSPADALAKVEATYVSAKQVQGAFVQTVHNQTFGKNSVSRGTFYVTRPDKLRWDYGTPSKLVRSFIFDGKTLWVVEPAKREVITYQTQTSTMPAAISFLTGAGSLAKEFTVRAPSDKGALVPGAVVLELVPNQPSAQYKQLRLVVDPQTWTVSRSIVTAPGGDVETFELSSVDLTAKLAPKVFEFSPKSVPGYKIIAAPAAAAP